MPYTLIRQNSNYTLVSFPGSPNMDSLRNATGREPHKLITPHPTENVQRVCRIKVKASCTVIHSRNSKSSPSAWWLVHHNILKVWISTCVKTTLYTLHFKHNCVSTFSGTDVWYELQKIAACICSIKVHTSQMIYHLGGEPERAMDCWLNVMAHRPWITAEFVTVCCSMSVVSNTLCSHFFGQWSNWGGYTHAFTKLHSEVMSWISCAYECRSVCMDLPEPNSITVHDL